MATSDTPRPALSRRTIAVTALSIIDGEGLAKLSMRRLGAELGVEAMSLYHYVANKNDLLDAVLEQLYSEIALPDLPDDDWEQAIRRGLRSFHDVLVRHPAAVELFTSRPAQSETGLRVLIWANNRFRAVGLSDRAAREALHFAVAFVMGHVATELGNLSQEQPEIAPALLEDDEIRAFVERSQHDDAEALFDSGIEAVVHGLRATWNLP